MPWSDEEQTDMKWGEWMEEALKKRLGVAAWRKKKWKFATMGFSGTLQRHRREFPECLGNPSRREVSSEKSILRLRLQNIRW